MKQIWTIGREREKEHAGRYVKSASQRALLFPVIDAVHDLNEGAATPDDFLRVAAEALTSGGTTVWNSVDKWIRDIAKIYPNANQIWEALSNNAKWSVRRSVAGRLYSIIPDEISDRLFVVLRNDPSAKVRVLAVERYEYRPDATGRLEKQHDASAFNAPALN